MKTVDSSERVQYVQRHFGKEAPLMKQIVQALEADNRAIQLGSHEGAILSGLVRMSKPKNAVEIGALYGYSACWIQKGFTLPGQHLWAVEKDKSTFEKASGFLKAHRSQITLFCGGGSDFLSSWPSEKSIDFLFIDADKGGYLNYLKLAMPYLKPGSVVVGDNTFLFGHVLSSAPPEEYSANTWKKMKEFNEILSGSTGEFEGFMLPTVQGLTVGVKK